MNKIFFFLGLFISAATFAQPVHLKQNCCSCFDSTKMETKNFYHNKLSIDIPMGSFALTKEQQMAFKIGDGTDTTVNYIFSNDTSLKFLFGYAKLTKKNFTLDSLLAIAYSETPKGNTAFKLLLSAEKETIGEHEWAVVVFQRNGGDVIKNNITYTTIYNGYIFNLGVTYLETEDGICKAKFRKMAKSVKFN